MLICSGIELSNGASQGLKSERLHIEGQEKEPVRRRNARQSGPEKAKRKPEKVGSNLTEFLSSSKTDALVPPTQANSTQPNPRRPGQTQLGNEAIRRLRIPVESFDRFLRLWPPSTYPIQDLWYSTVQYSTVELEEGRKERLQLAGLKPAGMVLTVR